MLIATVNGDQRERYLLPYARGETVSAIAISEPGAGSDPSGMTTRAERDGDGWRINGRKIWISRAPEADFTIAMARTDPGAEGREGITAFLIDRGTPGFEVGTAHPMLGGYRTYEVVFDNCFVSDAQVLGRVGGGFGPMQLRLTVRRLEMGAWSVAMAQRALDMMVQHAKSRRTFGTLLADRQAIQWWIADAATQIHATEMATEVIDHANPDLRRHGHREGNAAPPDVSAAPCLPHLRRPHRGTPLGHRPPPHPQFSRLAVGSRRVHGALRDRCRAPSNPRSPCPNASHGALAWRSTGPSTSQTFCAITRCPAAFG